MRIGSVSPIRGGGTSLIRARACVIASTTMLTLQRTIILTDLDDTIVIKLTID